LTKEERKIYNKTYNSLPEVKARRRAYRQSPGGSCRIKQYHAEYSSRPGVKDRKLSIVRAWTLKRKYGMTEHEYNSMLSSQNSVCAICFKSDPYNKRLSIDHDHVSGRTRGLLCTDCNRALGILRDDAERVESMMKYIRSSAVA
jgi:hypothetical protein